MKQKLPKHLSHNYRLEVDRLPTRASDRLSLIVLLPAVLLGFIMIVLGLLEMANGLQDMGSWNFELEEDTRPPFLNHIAVDISFIILGIGVMLSAFIAHIRYKKIYFNGRTFSEDFRGVFGDVELFKENLRNYLGVRFRVEFYQFGILTLNKYIIELEHLDPQKTIPLYISTSGNGIYDIWHYYAKMLNKPTITETDEGLVIKEVYELDQSLKEYLEISGLAAEYKKAPTAPPTIIMSKREDRIVITRRKMNWNAYALIGAVWLFFYTLILAGATYFYPKISQASGSPLYVIFFLLIGYCLWATFAFMLFKRDKIVLKDDRLILMRKFLIFSRKIDEIDINNIKDIEVTFNPATGTYYLSIIGGDRIITFGRKLSVTNLHWLKNFIIYEITK